MTPEEVEAQEGSLRKERMLHLGVVVLGALIMFGGTGLALLFAMSGGPPLEESAPGILSKRMLLKCEDLVDRLGEPVEVTLGGDLSADPPTLENIVRGSKATGQYTFVTQRSGSSWTVITADVLIDREKWDVITCRQVR